MNNSFSKAIYYENILEFKENTQSPLQLSEVHQWHLCRTCLNDVQDDASSANLNAGGTGVFIIGIDGQLIELKDILVEATGIEVNPEDGLPARICKDCLNRISVFYFFKLQIKRSEAVLRRMLVKLEEGRVVATAERKDDFNAVQNTSSKAANLKLNIMNDASSVTDVEHPLKESKVESLGTKNDLKQSDIDEVTLVDEHYTEKSKDQEIEALILGELDIPGQNTDKSIDCAHDDGDDDEKSTCDVNAYITIEAENQFLVDDIKEQTIVGIVQEVRAEKTAVDSDRKPRPANGKALLESSVCTLCNTEFPMQRMLIAHVRSLHPSAKAFRCRICGKMFTHLQSLSRHMQTHHLAKEYKKSCNICNKRFLRMDDWRRHERTHTGERPYVCPVCSKAFKQASELKEHSYTHSREKRFECVTCGHCLQSRNGLYIHKKIHAGAKRHKCPLCDESFVTKGELKSHKNVHSI